MTCGMWIVLVGIVSLIIIGWAMADQDEDLF